MQFANRATDLKKQGKLSVEVNISKYVSSREQGLLNVY